MTYQAKQKLKGYWILPPILALALTLPGGGSIIFYNKLAKFYSLYPSVTVKSLLNEIHFSAFKFTEKKISMNNLLSSIEINLFRRLFIKHRIKQNKDPALIFRPIHIGEKSELIT